MKNLVRVTASHKDENGKFKGTQEFNCRMDTDFLLYGEKEDVAKVFQKMIDKQMEGYNESYIFYSWAPVFCEPIFLEADFEEIWETLKEESHAPRSYGIRFNVEETETSVVVTIGNDEKGTSQR